MNCNYIDVKRDKALSRFVLFYFVVQAFNSVLQSSFNITGSILLFEKVVSSVFLLYLLIVALLGLGRRAIQSYFIINLLGLIPFLYSYGVGVAYSDLTNNLFQFYSICLPLVFCVAYINNIDILYSLFRRFAPLIFALWSLYILFGWGQTGHDMSFSYGILPIVLFYFSVFFITKEKFSLVVGVLGTILIFLAGSRGTLLCIVGFFVIKSFSVTNLRKRLFYIFILTLVSLIFYFFYYEILDYIFRFLLDRGIYSRTLTTLYQGEFMQSSGRVLIISKTIYCIKEKPFLGWGLGGAIEQIEGPYPHQFFLDFPLAFGVPIGLLIEFVLVKKIFKCFMLKNEFYKQLFHIFFCSGFLKLMFSGTVFFDAHFYVLLGLCFVRATYRKMLN